MVPGFTLDGPNEEMAVASSTNLAPSGLLALQELEAQGDERVPASRTRADMTWGKDATDALRSLQLALLYDGDVCFAFTSLNRLLERAPPVAEAGLHDVIEEIRVRVAVEAAKAERWAARLRAPGVHEPTSDGSFSLSSK
ncbi:hypothetical protein ANI02nite_28240 [Acetobacter nitrogenifigens DSM 23921 = NBRC 105050]|uniref:Uncharacterized protein n=1 Tax=Acetobacter nitrogenifigens DSM 23921 = NBRC 105050 TaxID=1120919 RepID=A0A511XDA8_9PROT|nr:hypothetical protein ANI02nite_28240 [Acetobacter nitrogenifigens DSM 23921 = NBRC 105050]